MEDLKSQTYLGLLEAVLKDAYLVTQLSKRAQHMSLQKDMDYAEGRMRLEGTSFFSKTLAKAGQAYTRSLDGISRFEPGGLKRYRNATVKSVLPCFAGEVFRCTHTNDGLLREDADPQVVRKVRTLLLTTYKMREDFNERDLEAYSGRFVACDRSLAETDFVKDCRKAGQDGVQVEARINRQYRGVLNDARILIHRVLQNADPMEIVPSHGPGAVAEGLKPWHKPYHSDMAEPMGDVYDHSYYVSGAHALVDNVHLLMNDTGFNDVAKVIFVPKDSRGPRVITCEPVAKQWIQQGLMRAMKAAISKSALTRDRVVLNDQSVNGVVAAISSVLGCFASVDLKDASDRVTVELVKFLFPDNWFKCMMAARSPLYKIQGSEDVRPLIKYAGMGNATTFPTEALCFWALSQALAEHVQTECQDVYVYGDDILLATELVEPLNELFSYVGLIINQEKSFKTGLFREACGYDAFKGQNVAPVRLKTLWDVVLDPSEQASAMLGLVEMANKNWVQYPNLSSYIYEQVKRVAPWVVNSDLIIPNAFVFNLGHHLVDEVKSRWNARYQKREYRVRVATDLIMRIKRGEDAPHRWSDVLQALVKPGQTTYRAKKDDKGGSADQYSIPHKSIIKVRWCAEGSALGIEPKVSSLEAQLASGKRLGLVVPDSMINRPRSR